MTARPEIDVRAVASRSDWAAAFTAVRLAADLSIRELSRRTDIPSATLGGWFSGRNLPQAGQLAGVAAVLAECGLTDDEAEVWTESVQRLRTSASLTVAGTSTRPASPYPGLGSFTAADSALFFGRDAETADILSRLEALRDDPGPSRGMLAVVGPSGSGKSSLLGAGLAAALARRTDTADPWTCAVLTPGQDPESALADALGRLGGGTRVLVVDQFEEVFTAVDDATVRARFLTELTSAPGTLVVLGMRADFYAAAVREPALVPVLQHAQLVLGPLGPDALRQAVTGPAAAVGVQVEDNLVELVLDDAAPRGATGEAHDAGALPLLSHALLSAWNRGSGPTLTVADYRAAGGIDGAVQHTAESAWAELDAEGRTVARSLFLRLVHVGDDIALTRRRVTGAELAALQDDDDGAAVRTVVDAFVVRRLLTAGSSSIEISHEALLSAWPRLRDWIDTDRAALHLHRSVTEAANAWEQAGRDDSLLPRGGRLAAVAELSASPSVRVDLNQLERDYVTAGVTVERAARDAARRRTGRLRRLLAAVAVLAVVAGVLAVYSARARSDADRAQRSASVARDEALSRQVAIESRQLADRDPALAQQLALSSYRISPTAEARSALTDFSARPVVARVLGSAGRTVLTTARGLAAVGHADGGVQLLSTTGAEPRTVGTLHTAGSGRAAAAVALTPDARTLFVADATGRLDVWDVARPGTPRRLTDLSLGRGFTPAAMSLTGDELLVAGAGPAPLQRWQVGDRTRPTPLVAPTGLPRSITLRAVSGSADHRYLAVGGDTGSVYVWDTTRPTAAPVTRPTGASLQLAVLFGTDRLGRDRLYVGDSEGAATAVDPATGRVLGVAKVAGAGWAQTLTLSADGSTLGIGSDDSTYRQFSTSTFALLSTRQTPTEVVTAAYLPGEAAVVLACGDGATYRVPLQGRRVPVPATTFNLAFDRAGDRLLTTTSGGGGGAQVWDVRGAAPAPVTPFLRMTTTADPATGGGTISPDGTLVALNNFSGQVQLFDLRDPARPRPWAVPFTAATQLVESMSLNARGDVLAMGSDDGSMSLWDVSRPATPRLLSRMPGRNALYDLTWSSDDRMVAAAGEGSAVHLWSVVDPARPVLRATLSITADIAGGVAFSHDGRLLAATGSDGRTRLWDITGTGTPRAHRTLLTGPTDYGNGLTFNGDDSLLAASNTDATVRLYDVRTGSPTPIASLQDVGGPVYSTRFSPDGRRLIGSGRAASAPVWTVDPQAAARELCGHLGAPITRSEWTQYVSGTSYDPPCR